MLAFTIAQAAPAFDPDSVTPGVIGFAATAVVAIAVCLLLFDMNRRVRRVKYREEVRAEIAAEQAAVDESATGEAGTDVEASDAQGRVEPGVGTSPSAPSDEQRTER